MGQVISIAEAQAQQDTAEYIILCRADYENKWEIFPEWKPEANRPHEYTIAIHCNNPKLIPVYLKQAQDAWDKGCRNTDRPGSK